MSFFLCLGFSAGLLALAPHSLSACLIPHGPSLYEDILDFSLGGSRIEESKGQNFLAH